MTGLVNEGHACNRAQPSDFRVEILRKEASWSKSSGDVLHEQTTMVCGIRPSAGASLVQGIAGVGATTRPTCIGRHLCCLHTWWTCEIRKGAT